MIELRPYQLESIDAVLAAEARGIRRPLIALPTGTGKTVVFAHLLSQRPGRSLVLVHRDELIRQAYAKLKEINPALAVGIVKAELDDHAACCVVASVQTLAREARLTRVTPDFRIIVCDEAHHCPSESWRRILDYCGAFSDDGPLTLGVTATPQRGDDVGLDTVFQEIVYRKGILEMIIAGYLADLRAIQISLKVDFNQLHTRAGDFIDSEMEGLLLEADAPEHVVNVYLEHARGRKTLLFTPTVKLAHMMAEQFQEAAIAAEAVDGTTPLDERRAILRRFHTGETRLVANVGCLTEGFDEPSIECVILTRPTRSTTLFTQMLGRGTRVYPGKADCLVLDLAGNSTRHDIVSVASLVGLPLTALQTGASVAEAAAEAAATQERERRHGAVVAVAVDLFRRRALLWLAEGRSFVLTLGASGWIVLTLDAAAEHEQWSATVIDAEGRRTCLAEGLSLAFAQGVAEDHVRKVGAGGLVNPKASWRLKEASDKQAWLLRKLHVAYRPGITAGQASDLISGAKLRQVLSVEGAAA